MTLLNKLGIYNKKDLQLAFSSDFDRIGDLFIIDYFIENSSSNKTRIGRASITIDGSKQSLTWFSFTPLIKELFDENSYLDMEYLDLDVLAHTSTLLDISKNVYSVDRYSISHDVNNESSPQRIYRLKSMNLEIGKKIPFKTYLDKSLKYAFENKSY